MTGRRKVEIWSDITQFTKEWERNMKTVMLNGWNFLCKIGDYFLLLTNQCDKLDASEINALLKGMD